MCALAASDAAARIIRIALAHLGRFVRRTIVGVLCAIMAEGLVVVQHTSHFLQLVFVLPLNLPFASVVFRLSKQRRQEPSGIRGPFAMEERW